MTTRRLFLTGAAGLAAAVGLSACGGGSGAGAGGDANIRLAWWGNEVRDRLTGEAVDAFIVANPDIGVELETGDWNSYWERLATQVAGQDDPDVIQMSINYVREYGDRGALADLTEIGVESADLAPGTVESGLVGDTLYGLNGGVNTSVILANPALFEAAGLDLPDDTTWTWEGYGELAAELTKALPDGSYGSLTLWGGSDTMLNAWLRQRGKALYTTDGLGFSADDIVPWFEMLLAYQSSGAIPPAALTAEDNAQALAQSLLGTGRAALGLTYSNPVTAMDEATGEDIVLLRPPSTTGKATERQAWFNASMQWSVSARTEHPEAAAALVNFLVNSEEGGKILLSERGLPANVKVREAIMEQLATSDQKAAEFLTAIEPELGEAPEIPIVGASDLPTVHQRWAEEVAFGRRNPAEAATGFVDEAVAKLR